ncbi:hypothetical protein B0H11DRAFT_2424596 [Mycena galericulata]|nr:hypothetical protein B0H11DRAFT_2424596 [Mycena galericulata]
MAPQRPPTMKQISLLLLIAGTAFLARARPSALYIKRGLSGRPSLPAINVNTPNTETIEARGPTAEIESLGQQLGNNIGSQIGANLDDVVGSIAGVALPGGGTAVGKDVGLVGSEIIGTLGKIADPSPQPLPKEDAQTCREEGQEGGKIIGGGIGTAIGGPLGKTIGSVLGLGAVGSEIGDGVGKAVGEAAGGSIGDVSGSLGDLGKENSSGCGSA